MRSVIIGLGAISKMHIRAIKMSDFTELVGVCDIREDRLNETLSELGNAVSGYSDYKKMICELKPDVVHVCTPHYLHKEMAIFALENGCDVYLEKPAGMNADEAREIAAVSRKTGKKVCVSFQNRVIPTNDTAKKYIEENRLGQLLGIRAYMAWKREGAYYTESGWRGTWEKEGGGVLMNQSIHTLDLMYYFGGKVKDIKGSVALRKNKGTIEVEDTAEATLWFESGATGIFYATNCNVADSSVEIELYFKDGKLLLVNDTLYENKDGELNVIARNSDYSKSEGKYCWGNGHTMMMERFYGAIGGKDVYYCDIDDAVPVLELIAGIYATSPCKLR